MTVAMSLTPLSAPVIIAKNRGYFKKNGLDVTIKDFVGGHRTIKAIFQGKADIATSSEAVVMFNSFKRTDFAILCTFVTSDNDVKIIARKNSGIRTVQDLVGHRVGTITGASAQFFLDETLLLAGIDNAKVTVVHVSPEKMASALAKGDIDASVVWEPLAYRAKQKLGTAAIEVPHNKIYTETFNAVILRDYAKKNPGLLIKFTRAMVQATRFIRDQPEQSQRIVATRIKKDLPFINAVWQDFKFGIGLHQWLLTTLEKEARWAMGRQLILAKKAPNYLNFLYLDALKQVSPKTVTVFY
nr:ABC transporter substrate-binding protein [Rhodospirillales bacterium]